MRNKPNKIRRTGHLFCSTEPFNHRCARFCAPLFLAVMTSGVWKKGVKLNICPSTEPAEGPPLCCSFPPPCVALRLQTLARGEPLQPTRQVERPCVKRAVFAPPQGCILIGMLGFPVTSSSIFSLHELL